MAVTAADPLDSEGRVLAQAFTHAPNHYRNKIRTTAVAISAAGHIQAEEFGR